MLIDSHAHIQGKEYTGEVAAVIARARAAGVETIVVVGGAGDMSSNSEAVTLAASFPDVYATVGMHPHDAKDVGDEELKSLKQLAASPKVVAVGETGLDYYYSHSPHETQRQVFGRFIQLARETKLPIVVHERDAALEAAELLGSEQGTSKALSTASRAITMPRGAISTWDFTFRSPASSRLRTLKRCGKSCARCRWKESWSRPTRPISRRCPIAASATSPPMCASWQKPLRALKTYRWNKPRLPPQPTRALCFTCLKSSSGLYNSRKDAIPAKLDNFEFRNLLCVLGRLARE